MKRTYLQWTLAGIFLLSFSAFSLAQTFPAKAIRIIVGYPAGGSVDGIARQLGVAITEKTGQSVVVDNRPGGSTVIAAQSLLSAPPDGYTVALFDPSTATMNPHLFKKLSYDAHKLTPVAGVVKFQIALVVAATSPAKSLKDFVDAARANAGAVSFGSTGSGNPVHLAMEQFKLAAGIDAVHVPYRGASPALTDLLGGQIPFLMVDLGSAMPYVKAGKVRVLAIAAPTRSAYLPEVPTFAESGYPKFSFTGWDGIFVPAGTPQAVVAQLSQIFKEASASPKFVTWASTVVLDPFSSTPEEFGNIVKADFDTYGQLIKRLGISLD
jgi:tripartite-type tricarboxylate transporter receptor subunit TctC